MRIIALSDIHGQLPVISESAEVMFICGDIIPLKMQNNYPQSLKWLREEFIPHFNNMSVEQIYLIAGNHDFFFESARPQIISALFSGTKIIYLRNENVDYLDNDGNTWNIFGSPDCHIFGNWAFMYHSNIELEDFNKMHDDCDIMITHDAAYGQNDICKQDIWYNKHEHIGNPEMAEVLKKKHPKFHFTGHLHTSDHSVVDYNGTKTACVSLLDEKYHMTYKPLILDIGKSGDYKLVNNENKMGTDA